MILDCVDMYVLGGGGGGGAQANNYRERERERERLIDWLFDWLNFNYARVKF